MESRSDTVPEPHDYRAYAAAGNAALLAWYNRADGLFTSTGWWNAANALGAVIDHAVRTGSGKRSVQQIVAYTFRKHARGKFLNSYYDDEGWWALTWLKAYDYTGQWRYLRMARVIFEDMLGGWDQICGGGVWWSKPRTYKNAIPNELFITLAARLYQRTRRGRLAWVYLDWAQRAWDWFYGSGLLNAANLINDGLTAACVSNNGPTWTYNQGVILGGLTDLYRITGQTSYLTTAEAIADAAIHTLVNARGILREPCEDVDCDGNGTQFKGIFMRNLSYLYETDHNPAYQQFIIKNAKAIWQRDRNVANQFGLRWDGPFDRADASRQSSALDALNAAIPFSGSVPL